MSELRFGKPNFSGGFEKTKIYKLGTKKEADRTMILRIAPPFGEAADTGTWRRFVKQHWGYYIKGSGDGNAKGIPVPFLCCEQIDRNGNVTVQCPECQERLKFEKKKEEKVAELTKLGKDDEEIKTSTRHLSDWLKEHNLDKGWWVIAKDLSGVWGHANIKYKAMKSLLSLISKLPGEADPLSPERGLWWKFTRTGDTFSETVDIPSQYQESMIVNGEEVFRNKSDTLVASDLEQLAKIPSLSSIGRVLTVDQIQMIVSSGGDEKTLRTVMNIPAKTSATPAKTPASQPTPAPAKAQAPEPAPEPEDSEPTTEDEVDEVEALKAALAAAEKAKAAKAVKAKAESAKPAETKPPTELSPSIKSAMAKENMDEFLKMFAKEQ